MDEFNWERNRELIKEWNDLYSSLKDILKDEKEHMVESSLFTMVMTEPHVFKKSQIISIKYKKKSIVGDYISLKIENEDGQSWVNVYPSFEVRTEGKIKDITLILMFIKDNINKSNSVLTETVIV